MSDETPTTTEPAPEAAPATTVPVAYEDASRLVTSGGIGTFEDVSHAMVRPERLDVRADVAGHRRDCGASFLSN